MPLTSRTQLRQDAARLTGLLLWSGVATGGTDSALTHTGSGGLRDTGMSGYLFEGAYLHITSTTDGTAPLDEWRMITPTGYDPTATTLQITVGEPFTAPIDAGDSYEIIAGLDPDEWNDTLNATLTQQMRHKWRSPITLIEDGDMEAVDTASWTSATATLSKVTNNNVLEGARSLRATNAGVLGYAASSSVAVNPDESFQVWADYRSHSGRAVMAVFDVTNGTFIASDESGPDGGTNRAGGSIVFGFTVPATCREVTLNLGGVGDGADIYWENVILMGNRRRYALPGWIEERDQFTGIEVRSGSRPADYQFSTPGPADLEETLTAQQAFRVVLPGAGSGTYFAYGDKKFTALDTEAATTSAPLEWAKYEVASAVYEIMGDEWRPRTRNYVGRNEVEKHLHSLRQLNQPREPKPVGGAKRPWTASRGFTW